MTIKQKKIVLVFLLLILNFMAYLYLFLLSRREISIVESGVRDVGGIRFYFAIYGPGGNLNPKFLRPYDIALDELGNIYVTDIDANRVCVFTRHGRFLREFGQTGLANPAPGVTATWRPGGLLWPTGIDVGSDGNVYVADSGNGRIEVFDAKGNFLRFLPPEDSPVKLNRPLALDVFKDRIYVVERGHLYVFTTKGGFVKQLAQSGREPGSLDGPTGIKVAEDGTIYVTDGLNMTLTAFKPDGTVRWSAGSVPASALEKNRLFGSPAGVDTDEKGRVFVVDSLHFSIHVYDRDGQKLMEAGSIGKTEGTFYFPRGIAVAPNGLVYVADSNNARVQAIRLKELTE